MLINSMIAAVAGLALAGFFANKVLSIKVTDSKVEELSTAIREGSMAFLKRMYSWISVFVVILAVLISVLTDWGYPWGSVAFVAGAVLSSLAGFIGMRIATAANGRTTEAARDVYSDDEKTAINAYKSTLEGLSTKYSGKDHWKIPFPQQPDYK